jgi:hypothetical protein
MYHWHRMDAAVDTIRRPASRTAVRSGDRERRTARRGDGPAARAVQVALDRRDNGGAAAATCGE